MEIRISSGTQKPYSLNIAGVQRVRDCILIPITGLSFPPFNLLKSPDSHENQLAGVSLQEFISFFFLVYYQIKIISLFQFSAWYCLIKEEIKMKPNIFFIHKTDN